MTMGNFLVSALVFVVIILFAYLKINNKSLMDFIKEMRGKYG
jgi:Na+/H+-dicarboxylate symporter